MAQQLTIEVDAAVCEGHGECVTVAPELFDLGDDEGAVHVIGQPDDADLQNKARGAERVCPVGAITLALREVAQN